MSRSTTPVKATAGEGPVHGRPAAVDRDSRHRLRGLALACAAGLCSTAWGAGPAPGTLPTNGSVVAGQAAISQSANVLNVNQTSQRAVLSWGSFNVGSRATVNFNQPNAAASTLNLVGGGAKSVIDGAVNAPGQVVFVNPNGVVFGKGAEVNAGGVVATTMNIAPDAWMNGSSSQQWSGDGTGKVVNRGRINLTDPNGYIALMAPEVRNEGVISATLSGANAVALVSGQKVSLTLQGSRLVSVSVDASAIRSLIVNRRLIQTDGGQVLIAANSANELMASVIRNTGTISATGISRAGGVVSLVAGSVVQAGKVEASATAPGDGGTVRVLAEGDITVGAGASISANGQNGGSVSLVSQQGAVNLAGQVSTIGTSGSGGSQAISGAAGTTLTGATLDASGATAGGVIQLGRDFRANPLPGSAALAPSLPQSPVPGGAPTSTRTVVDASTSLNASAQVSGQGGRILVWGDAMQVAGTLAVVGAGAGARAGFIETSGQLIDVGTASIRAGPGGVWLLDPTNVSIQSTPGTGVMTGGVLTFTNQSTISTTQIQNAINAGTSVSVIADGSINQYATLTFAVTPTGARPVLLLSNVTGAKQGINLQTITDTTSAAGSSVSLDVRSSGGAIVLGATTLTGSITVDNTWGCAGAACTPASGYYSAANALGNVSTTDGIGATNGNVVAGTGMTLRGVSDGGFGIRSNGTLSVSAGNLILRADNTGNYGLFLFSGSQLLASGDITVNGTVSGLGTVAPLIAVNLPNANSTGGAVIVNAVTTTGSAVTVGGITGNAITINASGTTSTQLITLSALTVRPGGGDIRITANDSGPGYGTGIFMAVSGTSITQGASGGSIQVVSNNIIDMRGPISLAANTSGATATVLFDASRSDVTGSVRAGSITVAAGSTSPVIIDLRSAGSTIALGPINTSGSVIADNTWGCAGPGCLPASGYLGTQSPVGLITTSNGINVAGTVTAGAGVRFTGLSAAANQYLAGICLCQPLTATGGDIVIDGRSLALASGVWVSAALAASTGSVSLTGTSVTGTPVLASSAIAGNGITITGSGTTATAAVSSTSSITVNPGGGNLSISGSRAATTGGNAVALSGLITMGAGGGDIRITATEATPGTGGLSVTGNIVDNASGSNITFVSNGALMAGGTITLAANNSTQASRVLYDDSGSTGAVTTRGGVLTTLAGVSPVNYEIRAAGGAIQTAGVVNVSGQVLLDNTWGCAGAGCTPASGFITAANAATLATTGSGVAPGYAITAGNGVVMRGITQGSAGAGVVAANPVTASWGDIVATGTSLGSGIGAQITTGLASHGAISITGTSASNYGIYATTLTADRVTANGVTASGNIAVWINGVITINAGGGDLNITGLRPVAGGLQGVRLEGNIVDNASGGNITLVSNNTIWTTSATISMAANNSGRGQRVVYDTSSGTLASSIWAGQVNYAASTLPAINPLDYRLSAAGANILMAAASVSGSVVADNTWGCAGAGCTPASGNITLANSGSLAATGYGVRTAALTVGGAATLLGASSSSQGVIVAGVLNAGGAILARAVSGGIQLASAMISSSGGVAVEGFSGGGAGAVINGPIIASGTFTSGQNAISILGDSPGGVAFGQVTLSNNSVGGDTTVVARQGPLGLYYGSITNAATAGAIRMSAVGASSYFAPLAGAVVTQNSNGGIYITTSNTGNLTPPSIVNNGTGVVALGAGVFLSAGDGTGGQITASAGYTLSSPNGNVYLYSGRMRSTTGLGNLSSSLTTLTLDTAAFNQAWHQGNQPATSLPDTAINTAAAPWPTSTTTVAGNNYGPLVLFRETPTYQIVTSANLTKVYGSADPSAALNSVAVAGSLENQISTLFVRNPTTNPGYVQVGGVDTIIISSYGSTLQVPLARFLATVTGTRALAGTQAGEQVSGGPYAWTLNSTTGIALTHKLLTPSGAASLSPLTLSITPLPITLTANAMATTYGTATPIDQTGYTVSTGLPFGDALTGVTIAYGGATSVPATLNAGLYAGALAPSAATFAVPATASNYSIRYVGGDLTVGRLALTASINGTQTMVYNAATATLLAPGMVTLSGFAPGQGATVGALVGTYNTPDVATATTVSARIAPASITVNAGTNLSNYTLPSSVSGPGRITPAPLTMTADDATTFIFVPPVLTYTLSGLRGADTAATAISGATVTNTSGATSASVNPGVLVPSATSSNYALTFVNGTLTILSNYQLRVAVGKTSNDYGTWTNGNQTAIGSGLSPSLVSASYCTDCAIGRLTPNIVNLTISAPASGSSQWTASDSLTGINGSTGLFNQGRYTFTITPVTNPASWSAGGALNVGNYTLAASGVSTVPGYSTNYDSSLPVVYQTGSLAVTPLALSFAGGPARQYDGTTFIAGLSLTPGNMVAGDALSVAATGDFASPHAGQANVPWSVTNALLGGADAANYRFVPGAPGTSGTNGTITPAPITVSATDALKTFDNTLSMSGATLLPSPVLVSGQLFTNTQTGLPDVLSGGSFTYTDVNAGTGNKTVAVIGVGVSNGSTQVSTDYIITPVNNTTSTINPAPLTVSGLVALSKVYDANTVAAVSGTPVLSGVIAGAPVTISSGSVNSGTFASADVASIIPVSVDVGVYTLSSGNYRITGVSTPLAAEITPAPVTVSGTRVYNASTTVNTLSVAGVAGQTLTISGAIGEMTTANVGNNALVTLTGTLGDGTGRASNYTLANPQGSVTITPASLTVRADPQNKGYATNDPTLTWQVDGLQGADTAAAVLSGSPVRALAGTLAGEQVGAYAIGQGTLTSNANYTIGFTPADLVIAPKALVIAPASFTIAQGQPDPAFTFTAQGLANTTLANGVTINDTIPSALSGALSRVPGTAPATYPILQGTLAAANYGLTVLPATLTILPAGTIDPLRPITDERPATKAPESRRMPSALVELPPTEWLRVRAADAPEVDLDVIKVPPEGSVRFALPAEITQSLVNQASRAEPEQAPRRGIRLLLLPEQSRLVARLPGDAPLPSGMRVAPGDGSIQIGNLAEVPLPLDLTVRLERNGRVMGERTLLLTR